MERKSIGKKQRTGTISDLNGLLQWLLADARKADGLGPLLEEMCLRLRAQDVLVDRATFGAPLLHPIAQSSFCLWDVDNGLSTSSLLWNEDSLAKVKNSPIHAIYVDAKDTDWRLETDEDVARFSVGAELRDAGFRHYIALALPFSDGSHKALTVQTKRPEGFFDDEKAMIKALVPAIATVVEHHVQRGFTTTLLNTFVGPRARQRVLNGNIHRGDGEQIDAVIWMSDLRGFTKYAQTHGAAKLLVALNTYFETVTDAIYNNGGEVLKFIGDAVLAIFPSEDDGTKAVTQAEAAAHQVLADKLGGNWPEDLDLGIGLHKGEVFFGNVGGLTRLDFTVIGPAVNLVSRIEALCAQTGQHLIVSSEFAAASLSDYAPLGDWNLKGIEEPITVYVLP